MTRRIGLLVLGPVLVVAVVVAVVVALNSPTPAPEPELPTESSGNTEDLVAAREAAGIAACPSADPDLAAEPDGLPELDLACLDGSSTVRLSGLRGEPMIINLWATWCGPCRQEAPHLAAFAEQQGDADPVQLLGIDIEDPDPAGALRFAEASDWTWPQLADPHGDLRATTGPAIPQTLFVDADGRIVHTKLGAFASVEELQETAERHLGTR